MKRGRARKNERKHCLRQRETESYRERPRNQAGEITGETQREREREKERERDSD